MLKVLTFTTLFPNSHQPRHGIFVKQRLNQLLASGEVESRVVAPVPGYPSWMPAFPRYEVFKGVPAAEEIDGLPIVHPKYVVIPKIGMTIAPHFLARASLPVVEHIYRSEFRFDLIDAHYFYPDGIAAAMIARRLRVPFVITARGTDINLIPKYRLARHRILKAADAAAGMITVCEALRQRLIELGADEQKIRTLRNGVEPKIFHPVDRDFAKRKLGIERKTLVSVGHLIERKGHHLTIQALAELKDYSLIIIGSGPEEATLRTLAESCGVADRCRFEGEGNQMELKDYYSACDASILASSREGMANVLLESMACGCPVVATDIWGTPEVVGTDEAGVLVPERTSKAISESVRKLFSRLPDRSETVRYSTGFHWDSTTAGQLEIFNSIVHAGTEK